MRSLHKTSFVALMLGVLMISMPMMGRQTADAQPAPYTVMITNASSNEIHRLYISLSGAQSWGPDRLGASILHRGESRSLGDFPAGQYDLLIVDAGGHECVMRNLSVPSGRPWSITGC
jgi:hypothetical protein